MKINDSSSQGLPQGIQQAQTNRAAETAPLSRTNNYGKVAESASGGSDQLQLSNLAGKIQASLDGSSGRTQYLEKLALDVKSGSYQVNSQDLSKSIIDDSISNKAK
jgi:anti-sigma28 factor (negative regulator of flagellin synthesis)